MPLLAAILGALLGYWARGLEGRKTELLDRIDDAVTEATSIQAVAAQYWSKQSPSKEGEGDWLAQEGEILGRLHMLNLMIEDLCPYFKSRAPVSCAALFASETNYHWQ